MLPVKSKWDKNHIQTEKIDRKTVHTKPNQAQSIRDILFRNTQGMSYDNYKTPYYEDQASFSSQPLNVIQDMEPADKLLFLADLETKTKNLKDKIDGYQKQQAELAQQRLEQSMEPKPEGKAEGKGEE